MGPVLPKRLRIEIAALIAVKLAVLAAIYAIFFAPHEHALTTLAQHLFSN